MEKIASAPARYWVVRKPDEGGTIVAKFKTPVGKHREIPEGCVATPAPEQNSESVSDLETDTSVLSDEEKRILGNV